MAEGILILLAVLGVGVILVLGIARTARQGGAAAERARAAEEAMEKTIKRTDAGAAAATKAKRDIAQKRKSPPDIVRENSEQWE